MSQAASATRAPCPASTFAVSRRAAGGQTHAAFRKHSADIVFSEPLRQAHDLYLATKVVDFPDNNYCHAVWHDIFVMESTPSAV